MIYLLPLYYFFFKGFKKSLPFIVSYIFIINHLGINIPILNTKYLSFLSVFFFLILSFVQLKKVRIDVPLKIIIAFLVIYSIYIISFVSIYNVDIKTFVRKTGPLIFQWYLFISYVYFKRFGVSSFLKPVYYSSILYLVVVTAQSFIPSISGGSVLGLSVFHDATVGLASSYFIGYSLIYKQSSKKLPIIIVSMLPFLGMARGGIIAVTTTIFLVYVLFKRQYKSILLIGIILLTIVLLSNYLIEDIIPKNIIYRHQGANNLSELLNESENIDKTILPRIIRWDFLLNKFHQNPFFGAGLMLSTIGSGLSSSAFYDVWQGHNFYLSMLAAGGLVLSLPIILLSVSSIIKIITFILKGNIDKGNVFAAILIFNVININFTNTYFIVFWSAPMIWALFGAGLFMLNKKMNSN